MYRKAGSILLLAFLALLTFSFYASTYESSTGDGGFGDGSGGDSGDGGPGGGNSEAPEADFTWTPDPPEEGESVSFQDQSSEGASSITNYEWAFEDHGTSSGSTSSVTFSDGGSYQVTLKVTDDNGESDTAVKTVNVEHDNSDDDDPGDDDYPIECHARIGGSLVDSDQDGDTGLDDTGCVAPLPEDDVEGAIWENHISSTITGDPTSGTGNAGRPQFYMSNSATIQGNDLDNTVNEDTYDDSGTYPEADIYYADYEGSEGGSREDWGFGILEDTTFDTFPAEATVHNDRIVLPPHNLDGGMCGDGIENTGDSTDPKGDDDSSSPPDSNTEGYDTDCRADWGRRWERYDVSSRGSKQPGEPGEQSGFETEDNEIKCRDDNMDSEGNNLDLSCDDGKDASCSDGDSSCPCGGATGSDGDNATCDSAEDWSEDEGKSYWYESSGTLYKETCETDGTETYASGSSGSDKSCTNYDGVDLGTGECQSCVDDGDSDYYGGDSDSVSGTNRDWKQADSQNCDTHNTVDGGTDSPYRYANSDAATYTDFTSYFDSDWGSEGRVWCGFDYTTTVDADGPQGLSDGFVVIEEGDIVATENLERNDEVGDHVSVDGSNIGNQDTFLNLIDTGCNGKRTCMKYVNYYSYDSGYTLSDNPSASEVAGSAVRADESRAYTADESYSVCKNINRINEEHGGGHPLIDCDYSQPQPSGGHADISPLPEACGDDTQEHVMVFDGNEVDQTVVQDYPIYYQECVSWDSADDEGYFYSEHGQSLDSNSCAIQGEAVAEGTVANVASTGNIGNTVIDESFEEGSDSPDWEVCLNIDQSNSNTPYNHRYNDASNTAFGGQWYDLDDEVVNDYLRSNEGRLGLSTDQRAGSPRYIDYYYGENPSPYDAEYNPEGGRTGTSLVADCGPLLDGCGENQGDIRGAVNDNEGTFFGFFEEDAWDDDAHPHGGPSNEGYTARIDWLFIGHMNMIKSLQDISGDSRYNGQISSGHPDYEDFSREWYENTMIDADNSVLYSYTLNNTWVIDSTGAPYPAYSVDLSNGNNYEDNDNILEESDRSLGVHYNVDYTGDRRTGPDSSFDVKTDKAMGNSLAVLSNNAMNDEEGNEIESGEAFWIDPDDIRYHLDEGNLARLNGGSLEQIPDSDWKNLAGIFEIDLTGPDSGLGWDYGKDSYQSSGSYDPDDPDFGDESHVVFTEIAWENDSSGDVVDPLEPPMCGDDSREYLLEEQGEADNTEQFTGTYVCATTPDYCVYDRNLYESGEYEQANEPGEEEGRLKQDEEVCSQDDQIHEHPIWFDQDYAQYRPDDDTQELCNANSLYGPEGQQWIDYDEINNNPHAFTGGIDDSWSERLDQGSHASLESDYEGEEWTNHPLDAGYTPVQTGFDSDRVADPSEIGMEYGFCGGDDTSEYLIHQDSQSEYVETDQSIQGVAASPDSCVLDNSEYSNIDSDALDKDHFTEAQLQDERMLYNEGDSVTFDSGDTRRTVACYGGQWWSSWPIVFMEDTATVDLGETGFTSFRIINPDQESKTFELGINPRGSGETADDLDQMVSFEDTGTNDMTVTVPGQSSNTYRLEIQANREINTSGASGTDIEVFAESSDGSLDGEDQVDIATRDRNSAGSGESRTIPGLTLLQLAVIAAVSSLIFFRN
ncbi:MAG: PKD domain-containing protein [Candidatus Nanohaloarchaea archaeon]